MCDPDPRRDTPIGLPRKSLTLMYSVSLPVITALYAGTSVFKLSVMGSADQLSGEITYCPTIL